MVTLSEGRAVIKCGTCSRTIWPRRFASVTGELLQHHMTICILLPLHLEYHENNVPESYLVLTWVNIIVMLNSSRWKSRPACSCAVFPCLKANQTRVTQEINLMGSTLSGGRRRCLEQSCFYLSPLLKFNFASALGYQLNSAECMDIRLKRVVPDHYCHYYPENKKPKPKLKECNMDPCPSRFVWQMNLNVWYNQLLRNKQLYLLHFNSFHLEGYLILVDHCTC